MLFIFDEAVEERGLKEYAIYHGPKYGDEKKIFFSNADIFVFPTYYYNETFGLVNLEAMQYKLPIVTTNEGGIPDVVKNEINGFICKRKDACLIADAIEKLLDSKELRLQMGEAGYQIFKEKFTLKVFNYNITKILKFRNP